MKQYHKLVRDLVPRIIAANGNKCDIEYVPEEQITGFLFMNYI